MIPLELRLLTAFLLASVAVLLITPLAIRIANRFQLWDRPHGYKAHKAPTPYLGGAAVVVGFLAGALALGAELGTFAPVLAGMVALAAVGLVDDWRTVRPAPRLVAEALAAVLLWATGLGWNVAPSEPVNLALTIAWVVGLVNAFNLMDNIDGAASTVVAVSSAGVAALALLADVRETAILALALAGTCAAFLRYNLAGPARIFLGDGGSMPIGFAVAAMLMTLSASDPTAWETLVPATFIAGLPIIDTGLVMVSRHRRGAAICKGGCDHTTHRLLRRLRSPRRVVVVLAGVQGLLGLAGLLAFETSAATTLGAGGLFAVLGLAAVVVFEKPQWIRGRHRITTTLRPVPQDLDRSPLAAHMLNASTPPRTESRGRA